MSEDISTPILCAALRKDIEQCEGRALQARRTQRQCDWREKPKWRETEIAWRAQIKALKRVLRRLETNG